MRIATVDIGTNTVRLFLADAFPGPFGITFEAVERHEVITKLGEGLDTSGELATPAMERALAGLEGYASLIAGAGVEIRGGVATSATRSASNGWQFIDRAADVLGFRPRVIDGIEEARLTFLGATAALDRGEVYCVIDVGGGSTEFVIGSGGPEYATSIAIGSVRLTERVETMALDDPLAIRTHVDGIFNDVVAPVTPSLVLGTGGTFVTLGAVARGVSPADIASEQETTLAFDELVATVDRLLGMSVAQIAELPAVPAARAEVLQAGVICAERAVAHIGADAVTISVSDILDGLALELATTASR